MPLPNENITLRDYFAGQALAGVLANPYTDEQAQQMVSNGPESSVNEVIARWAYEQADAMLTARKESAESTVASLRKELDEAKAELEDANDGYEGLVGGIAGVVKSFGGLLNPDPGETTEETVGSIVSQLEDAVGGVIEKLPKTADGVLFVDLPGDASLYCPHCASEICSHHWDQFTAYCESCPEPGTHPPAYPRPLFPDSCYSTESAAIASTQESPDE